MCVLERAVIMITIVIIIHINVMIWMIGRSVPQMRMHMPHKTLFQSLYSEVYIFIYRNIIIIIMSQISSPFTFFCDVDIPMKIVLKMEWHCPESVVAVVT